MNYRSWNINDRWGMRWGISEASILHLFGLLPLQLAPSRCIRSPESRRDFPVGSWSISISFNVPLGIAIDLRPINSCVCRLAENRWCHASAVSKRKYPPFALSKLDGLTSVRGHASCTNEIQRIHSISGIVKWAKIDHRHQFTNVSFSN